MLASGIVLDLAVDQLERARGCAHRVGMERQIVLLREMEDADQVDRIAREDVGLGDIDAVIVDDEVVGFAQAAAALARLEFRHHAAERRRVFRLQLFQGGAQDGGEVADILRDQEVMLHEALDILHAGMLGIAEPHRDLALDVEGEALLRPAGDEMHVAAHRPQEILAAPEQLQFVLVEHAMLDQFLDGAHAIDVFAHPEQRMQIAQAALAVLDVGLDEVARLPGLAQPLLALGELRRSRIQCAVPCTTFLSKRVISSSNSFSSPNRKRASRIAVRMVMSALAWRMHSSTDRVAWPTFSPMSQRQ